MPPRKKSNARKRTKEKGFNNKKILKICSILPSVHEAQQHEKELKLVHSSLRLLLFHFFVAFSVSPQPAVRD